MSQIRAALLGGMDGIITSFAIVAGVEAGGLSNRAVTVVGISSLVADGISMGISEYISSSAERSTKVGNVNPLRLALLCFTSFIANGAVPLFLYGFVLRGRIIPCAALFLLQVMALGFLRSLVTSERVHYGISQTALLGSIAGGTAYAVATLLQGK